jgi:hypothetical protein
MKVTLLDIHKPWQAALVSVPSFPVLSSEDRAALLERVKQVVEEMRVPEQATRATFLQLWNLGPDNGGSILQQHMASWQPEFGMGVWPTREPPQGWTETSMMDNAAAVLLGEEPEMPNHRVLRLQSDRAVQQQIASLLRGYGTLIQVQTRLSLNEFLQNAEKLFLPRITEARFQSEPFYFPLLDVATLNAAATLAELDRWMCGATLYVRESAVDAGVLILARSSSVQSA